MKILGMFLTLSLSLLAAQAAAAETSKDAACSSTACGSATKCARCGRECCCQERTCQLVCGKEKVKKYCWEVKCEEFCPLLPGHACDECTACRENGACQNAGKCGEKCPNPIIRTPHCGNARVKKTLVKKEYECERPKYKCVVQYLCPECAAGCQSVPPAPAEGANPATPAPAAQPEAPQPKTTFTAPLPPVMGVSVLTK